MLKGIIFDLDGVVADSHPVHLKAWKRFFASLGVDVSDRDLTFILDGRKREDILRHFLGELTPEQVCEYGRRKEFLFQQQAGEVGHIAGVPQFLQELRDHGIDIALASCGGRARVHFLLDKLEVRRFFSSVVTGEDVPNGKPDPAIFCLAAQKLNVSPHEVVVVEDAVSGVRAAKSAGMKCLGIAEPEHAQALRQAGADDIAPDFLSVDVPRFARLVD